MVYVARWRMHLASKLLSDRQLGISQISTQAGYENVAAFSRSFKRHVGSTPGAWRTSILVIAAIMAPSPVNSVLDWLNNHDTSLLYLSTITIAEIGYGLRILPDGKRRKSLSERFMGFLAKGFEQRILNFNERAAYQYAEVMGHRKEIGRPLSIADGQIASIASANDFVIATRNIRDFEERGIKLIYPYPY